MVPARSMPMSACANWAHPRAAFALHEVCRLLKMRHLAGHGRFGRCSLQMFIVGGMQMLMRWAIALTLFAGAAAPQARADAVEDFYKGKTVTMIVSYGPGGGYDIYGRL